MSVSFWVKKAVLYSRDFDVAIIGSGLTGLSCAYWFHKKYPSIKIIVVEQFDMTLSASTKNAGFLTSGSLGHFADLVEKWGSAHALEHWMFCKENRELLNTEILSMESIFNYRDAGSITLAKINEFERYEESFEILKKNKFLVQKISPIQTGLKESFDHIYHQMDEGNFDPYQLMNYFKQKLIEGGVYFLNSARVQKVESETLEVNFQGTLLQLKARQIIIATNYAINNLMTTSQKIMPQRAQIAHFFTPNNLPWFNYYHPAKRVYFRRTEMGIVVGGLRLLDEIKEQTDDDEVNDFIQANLEQYLMSYITSNFNHKYCWAGVMGFTEDQKPICGKVLDKEIYYLGGYSGHGNGYAFKASKYLVEIMSGDIESKKKFLLWSK